MTDKIGVLGSATVATAATTVVYTVPSAKAAKVKIMYEIQGAADATTDFTLTVNGLVVMTHANITGSNYLYSSPAALKEGPLAGQADGVADATTLAPAPAEYYLTAANTISYTIAGTTALSCNVQIVGTEVDV